MVAWDKAKQTQKLCSFFLVRVSKAPSNRMIGVKSPYHQ